VVLLPDVVVLRSLTETWAPAGLTSIGLDVIDGEYLRAAVRPHWPVLVNAIAESLQ
jgi:hypothetical protein